jgi:hypothetical protein
MDGSATLILQAEIKKWRTDLLLLEFPGATSSVSRRPLGGGGAGGHSAVVEQAGSSVSLQATDAGLGVNSRAAPVPHARSTSS